MQQAAELSIYRIISGKMRKYVNEYVNLLINTVGLIFLMVLNKGKSGKTKPAKKKKKNCKLRP